MWSSEPIFVKMKKIITAYVIVLAVLTVASVIMLRMLWPEHYPSGLFLIPLFFTAMLGLMACMRRSNEKKGRDRSLFFMGYRIVKILLAIVLILVYFTAVGDELLAFAAVFTVYYLCLSFVETVLFMKEERKS